MIHLTDISWTQWFLIEVGALLQVVAICAYVKDAAANRGFAGHSDDTTANEEEADSAAKSGRAQADHPAANNGGHLVRTAKVKFVQSFKFREQDSNQHFSGN